MRKLIAVLLATACVGLADAQFRIDDTVGVAGSDPAGPKAGAVQGITGGVPIPVAMPAGTTLNAYVLNIAGIRINPATNEVQLLVEWRLNTGTGHLDDISTTADALLNTKNAQKNAWGDQKVVLIDNGGSVELDVLAAAAGNGILMFGRDATNATAPLLQDANDRAIVSVGDFTADMQSTTINVRAAPNPNAPEYFYDRFPDIAVAEQLLIAGSASTKPRVLEWEVLIEDGGAAGTLHFEGTEITGASSNVFGSFSRGIEGIVVSGDDWSPRLWGTVNTPVYMNVEFRTNTFTRVSVRLITRQE